jgi:hypothetical protein
MEINVVIYAHELLQDNGRLCKGDIWKFNSIVHDYRPQATVYIWIVHSS